MWWGAAAAQASRPAAGTNRWFTSSDGVRLHYLEAWDPRRDPQGPTLVFVPGWTMPAWIWHRQILRFAQTSRVLAFDPRGQGGSQVARGGYEHVRRAADIAELLRAARAQRDVVLVGWSLGVLESLQFMHDARAAGAASAVAGLVLVDNSVGVGSPLGGNSSTFFARLRTHRQETVTRFVQSMFKKPVEPAWIDSLVADSLRMPMQASIDLLRQGRPREFWRDALYATEQPVLYACTPRYAEQAEIVKAQLPNLQTRIFPTAGHALFVDEAEDFNETLQAFLGRLEPRAPGVPR